MIILREGHANIAHTRVIDLARSALTVSSESMFDARLWSQLLHLMVLAQSVAAQTRLMVLARSVAGQTRPVLFVAYSFTKKLCLLFLAQSDGGYSSCACSKTKFTFSYPITALENSYRNVIHNFF